MEMLNNLGLGFAMALSVQNVLFCFVGVLVGTLVGVLPGLGPLTTIAILLPITATLDPAAAMIMLAGIYYGAQYGGSTTAILINVPGESSSAVTAIDGYQMAQRGQAGPALAIAAIASFVAGTIATGFIAIFALPMTELAIKFGPHEYFALIVLGILLAATLARGSLVNSIATLILGLLLGLVGTDVYTGAQRFTFGMLELSDGLSISAVAIGIFGIAEILRNLESREKDTTTTARIGRLALSRAELNTAVWPALRGTVIGSVLGVLPGAGPMLASFTAYAAEKKLAKDPSRFGYGAIEGVAAPEAANNAGAQSSYIPLLTLGLPGSPVMALMIGALIIQGIVPGPQVVSEKPDLFWGLIVSMWIGNLMLIVLNLPLVGLWVQLLRIPYVFLFPAIVVFSAIGILAISGSATDVVILAGFGVFGYLMSKIGCEPAPLLLGFVLGPMLEEHFRRALLISGGDLLDFMRHPISLGLLVLAVGALIVAVLPGVGRARNRIFVED